MTRQWCIPTAVLTATETALRRYTNETFVMWVAPSPGTEEQLTISRCIVPEQRAGITPEGVYVHIDGAELSRIQIDNFRRHERSVVQLHTHPGKNVQMSELDREWEVVAHVGALSIIVPDYCRYGLRGFDGANVYERETHHWRLWDTDEAKVRLLCR